MMQVKGQALSGETSVQIRGVSYFDTHFGGGFSLA